MLPLKGETGAVWPWRGCNKASWRQSPPVPRGVWGQEQSPYGGQRPPPTAGLGFQLPHLTLGTGFAKSRRGVEKPKGTEQLKIAARGRSRRGE
jgi:hypothetical protein